MAGRTEKENERLDWTPRMNGDQWLNLSDEDVEKMPQKFLIKILVKATVASYRKVSGIEDQLLNPNNGIYSRISDNTRNIKWLRSLVLLILTVVVGLIVKVVV